MGADHGVFSVPLSRWQSLRFPNAGDFSAFRTPTSSNWRWWPTNGKKDPMIMLANKLGLRVDMYNPAPAPWGKMGRETLNLQLFLGAVVFWLYINRTQAGFMRQFAGVVGILTMISWPFIYGQTGLNVVDFGIPAYAFLATLHFVDIFFTRDPEETADWSYTKMYAEALTFPAEHQSKYPRLANLKVLGLCFLKYLATNIILYSAPNADVIRNVKNPIAWTGYHFAIGGCILFTLGWMIEGSMRLTGTILGYEQNPLFANPMGSPNLRLFWGRWNLVIKDGLHRAIFKPQKKKQQQKSRAAVPAGKNGSRAPVPPGLAAKKRFQYKDQLSETEMESSAEDHGAAAGKQVAQKSAPPSGSQPPRKRGSFTKKAFAAMATFIVSGAFHEYMNHLAFQGASGETLAFFVVHAAAVITYTWLSRNAPQVLAPIPNWLGCVITLTFTFFTSPLFCAPFVRSGFFEQLKNGGMFGPVRGFIYVWGK